MREAAQVVAARQRARARGRSGTGRPAHVTGCGPVRRLRCRAHFPSAAHDRRPGEPLCPTVPPPASCCRSVRPPPAARSARTCARGSGAPAAADRPSPACGRPRGAASAGACSRAPRTPTGSTDRSGATSARSTTPHGRSWTTDVPAGPRAGREGVASAAAAGRRASGHDCRSSSAAFAARDTAVNRASTGLPVAAVAPAALGRPSRPPPSARSPTACSLAVDGAIAPN